jgi:two-component system chemotaxis response regulator CheB
VIVHGPSLADDVARCRGLGARGCAHIMNRPVLRGDGTLDPDWLGAMQQVLRALESKQSLFPPTPEPGSLLKSIDNQAAKSLVVIGASTGGPEALARVLADLPADLPVPVVIAQHIPKGFSGGLADSLGQRSTLPVIEAHEDTRLEPGVVVVAPGGRHLAVRKTGRIVLTAPLSPLEPAPSVDVLFRSAAAAFGRGTLAVVLTGMGNDGSEGVRSIHESGGTILAQDAPSCTVFGMPREAIATGCVEEVVGLDRLGRHIADHVMSARRQPR